MAENSSIEWTDSTFNPWVGCSKVSPGCQLCYAKRLMDDRFGRVNWGPSGTRERMSDAYWRKPLTWNRAAGNTGTRMKVFCASLADVFEDRDELVPWRADLFELIEATPNLDWQLLTKRPELVLDMVPASWLTEWPAHVWMGTSVEDQQRAWERVPALLEIPAPVRFLSCEPLLGPLYLDGWFLEFAEVEHVEVEPTGAISWVIVGGESGPGARPLETEWVERIIESCRFATVPVFVKQLGERPCTPGGAYYHLQDSKGGDWNEWPAKLRVREFPEVGR